MRAAGHAEMTVVCRAEKPKPWTIWLENLKIGQFQRGNSPKKRILTWLANVEGIVLPLCGITLALHQNHDKGIQCSLHCSDKEEDGLWISQCFPKLRPFPVIVCGDGLILSHSIHCDLPLAWSEPPGIGVAVRHKICKDQRKDKAEGAEEEEENLPCGY